ncbi:hypothetical protein B566_EDAN004399 [Ephemera danica]|nr:hypothetical protein B566_EDAN004399 [Ephemera danica]
MEEATAEKRGDLIVFYNKVYVIHMKDFSVKFSDNPNNAALVLSPLPAPKSQPMSPKVRVAESCNLFISALDRNSAQESPARAVGTLAYYFSRSPVETLRQINNMVNSNPSAPRVGKRILQDDSETTEIIVGIDGSSPTKKVCTGPVVTRKIQNLIEDRLNKSQE